MYCVKGLTAFERCKISSCSPWCSWHQLNILKIEIKMSQLLFLVVFCNHLVFFFIIIKRIIYYYVMSFYVLLLLSLFPFFHKKLYTTLFILMYESKYLNLLLIQRSLSIGLDRVSVDVGWTPAVMFIFVIYAIK